MPAKPIKVGCGITRFEVRKLIKFIRNKEELPKNWQESIIVPIYKKGERQTVVLLSTTYTIFSNTLLSNFTLYAGEFSEDHQYGLRRNRSTTDHKRCTRQILEKK
jgi:hypothetical protein